MVPGCSSDEAFAGSGGCCVLHWRLHRAVATDDFGRSLDDTRQFSQSTLIASNCER